MCVCVLCTSWMYLYSDARRLQLSGCVYVCVVVGVGVGELILCGTATATLAVCLPVAIKAVCLHRCVNCARTSTHRHIRTHKQHFAHLVLCTGGCEVLKVGHNRIYAPYITVYLVISLPKIPYIHRMYMVLANPRSLRCGTMWVSLATTIPACLLLVVLMQAQSLYLCMLQGAMGKLSRRHICTHAQAKARIDVHTHTHLLHHLVFPAASRALPLNPLLKAVGATLPPEGYLPADEL